MNRLYETKISDKRWYLYDIPGNVGWIAYIVCVILGFIKHGEYAAINNEITKSKKALRCLLKLTP